MQILFDNQKNLFEQVKKHLNSEIKKFHNKNFNKIKEIFS